MIDRYKLNSTNAPALPFSPTEYSRPYQDGLTNILRQYFLTIDTITQSLLSDNGGRFLSNPHIAASESISQYATGSNVATKVLWNTLDSGSGFTLNPNSTATAQHSGVYKIDYSLQFVNTDSQIKNVFVWLQVNGADVSGSSSKFSIPNKHGGSNGFLVAYSSFTFEMLAGQSVALYWATDQAYVVSPLTDGVFMEGTPAQTTPFAMPSIPSAVGSIVFVSAITT